MKIENQINKIITEDNITYLKKLPDCCIDLVVTSPPYDNLRSYKGFSFPFEKIANEIAFFVYYRFFVKIHIFS